MTTIKTVVVTSDITTNTTWLGNTKYIIGANVAVKPGVILNIYDTAQICFLSGQQYNLLFESGSKLNAGVISSYGVDSSYNPVTVANSGSWLFRGTKYPRNGVIPVQDSKFIINQLTVNYVGVSTIPTIAGVTFSGTNSWESNINVLSISNCVKAITLINGTINLNKLILNNNTKLDLTYAALNVYQRLTVAGGFIPTADALATSTLLVNKCGTIDVNTPLLYAATNIATTDTRVPTTKPYASPYVARAGKLKSKVLFYIPLLVRALGSEENEIALPELEEGDRVL